MVQDDLVESYLRSAGLDAHEAQLSVQLDALRAESDRALERRRAVFVAYEDDLLSAGDLQWRLDDLLRADRERLARIADLEGALCAMRSSRARFADVKAMVASAATNWQHAAIDDRRALAKSVCAAFGGCTVAMDGKLI